MSMVLMLVCSVLLSFVVSVLPFLLLRRGFRFLFVSALNCIVTLLEPLLLLYSPLLLSWR